MSLLSVHCRQLFLQPVDVPELELVSPCRSWPPKMITARMMRASIPSAGPQPLLAFGAFETVGRLIAARTSDDAGDRTPQWGQISALVLTFAPHSRHGFKAIDHPRNGRMNRAKGPVNGLGGEAGPRRLGLSARRFDGQILTPELSSCNNRIVAIRADRRSEFAPRTHAGMRQLFRFEEFMKGARAFCGFAIAHHFAPNSLRCV